MSDQKHRNETSVTLPSDLEIRIEREFEAPPELVWECYADPELVVQWLAPWQHEMRVEEYDFRPGGKWRYVHSDENGEYIFYGEFETLEKPVLLTQSFNFVMDPPMPPAQDRAEFHELDGGRTRLVTTSTFVSKDLRDGLIQSGMEKGLSECNERLDELLVQRQAGIE